MKKYKTEALKIEIVISDYACQNSLKDIYVSFNDGEGLGAVVNTDMLKQQFNDTNFIKHIFNFFIKD